MTEAKTFTIGDKIRYKVYSYWVEGIILKFVSEVEALIEYTEPNLWFPNTCVKTGIAQLSSCELVLGKLVP